MVHNMAGTSRYNTLPSLSCHGSVRCRDSLDPDVVYSWDATGNHRVQLDILVATSVSLLTQVGIPSCGTAMAAAWGSLLFMTATQIAFLSLDVASVYVEGGRELGEMCRRSRA